MSLFNKVFKSYSEKEVNRIKPIIKNIEDMDADMQKLSDEELKNKTLEFKERLQNGETLDDILPEAFAVVREGAFRVIGLKHFREQLIGGVVLHQGRIAEMKTGEGKTLVATLPSYLNALEGNGIHVVTVNDYLAQRDKNEMGKIHEFLGLTVGVIVHDSTADQRKAAYNCDIMYITNTELGFDYLRDNMAKNKKDIVQRSLSFAIVDEVDSILIDESRTPLVISGQSKDSTDLYKVVDFFVKALKNETDFEIDKKTNSVILTEEGIKKAEVYFNLENYADVDTIEIQHYINQSLKGNYLMKKDIDYIVNKNGEVIIIDEFTGRIMEGRKYSDGLHQAIEAKECVKINNESKTFATITFQNYFRMYNKLSGMTGTALTEELEFRQIYSLDVISIPTHMPIQRIDKNDIIYKTEKAKFDAIIEDIVSTHETGQPVLIGTVSIEKSEFLSNLLKKKGIPHQVLNAKYHEKEAEIISHAGEDGMITIATNMAGRGTDIKLYGDISVKTGLKIIGTERHESRRIDNQLRGRSGRQGNPGISRFYVSLEDDLIRIFGGEKLQDVIKRLNIPENKPINSKMIANSIKNAQKKVEGNNFDERRTLIKYDDVISKQRKIIYNQRYRLLQEEDLRNDIQCMIKDVLADLVDSYLLEIQDELIEPNLRDLIDELEEIFLLNGIVTVENLISLPTVGDIKNKLYDSVALLYTEKENLIGSELMRKIERTILLKVVDDKWMDHINDMCYIIFNDK